MNFITSLFTFKELIIMGSVVGGLILLVIIFSILALLEKRKDKEEVIVLEDEINSTNSFMTIDEEPKEKFKEPILIEKKIEPEVIEKKEIKEPLIMEFEEDKAIVEVEEKTLEESKAELEKITSELENPKTLEDTITSLEAMEEESAIISYQELIETTKEMNIIATDTGDEFISINELFKKYNEPLIKNEMTDVPINDAYKGDFVSSPYLSPIEGVESQNLNEIQLENTANLEKLDKEIRKTNEFLNILNELKKNLE